MYYWLNCTLTCLVIMLALEKFIYLWRSTKEVNMLCPTRFVVDATENSKEGGVAAELYSPQTGLFMILTFMHVCVRTYLSLIHI